MVGYQGTGVVSYDGNEYRWLAMDYIEGRTLGRVLAEGATFDLPRAVEVIRQAISGAAAKGLTTVVKRLLDMNARLDLTDSGGCNVLYFACAAGQTEIAELLLKQNKDLATVANNNGETPIVPAVLSGKAKLIALLRRHGANIDAKDGFGVPIISRAISCGHRDIVKDLVLHHADLENRNESWDLTPLHYAAYYADDKVLRLVSS